MNLDSVDSDAIDSIFVNLPTDLIPAIMAYWGGHRLGLTCRRWLGAVRIENYVTEHKCWRGIARIRASILPNGKFHGRVTVRKNDANDQRHEYIYDHNMLVRTEVSWTNYLAVNILVRGWRCEWATSRYDRDPRAPYVIYSEGGRCDYMPEVTRENFVEAATLALADRPGSTQKRLKRPNAKWINEVYSDVILAAKKSAEWV